MPGCCCWVLSFFSPSFGILEQKDFTTSKPWLHIEFSLTPLPFPDLSFDLKKKNKNRNEGKKEIEYYTSLLLTDGTLIQYLTAVYRQLNTFPEDQFPLVVLLLVSNPIGSSGPKTLVLISFVTNEHILFHVTMPRMISFQFSLTWYCSFFF